MTNKEYDKAKEECWKAVKKELDLHYWGGPTLDIVSLTFDRAYALGREREIISQDEIDKAAEDYVSFKKGGKCILSYIIERACRRAFKGGANFALGKQETKQEPKQEPNSSQNGNTSNYSGNHFADVRNMVNTRLHIAAMVMAGALANKNVTIGCSAFEDNLEYITKTALMYADALIAECEKGGNL